MAKMKRMIPEITHISKPFWDSVHEGKLMIQKCNKCGKLIHHPKIFCPDCMAEDMTWEEVSGKGFLAAYYTFEEGTEPFEVDGPLTVATVVLDCGIALITNIVDTDLDELKPGMPVEFLPLKLNDEVSLPVFKKAE